MHSFHSIFVYNIKVWFHFNFTNRLVVLSLIWIRKNNILLYITLYIVNLLHSYVNQWYSFIFCHLLQLQLLELSWQREITWRHWLVYGFMARHTVALIEFILFDPFMLNDKTMKNSFMFHLQFLWPNHYFSVFELYCNV